MYHPQCRILVNHSMAETGRVKELPYSTQGERGFEGLPSLPSFITVCPAGI